MALFEGDWHRRWLRAELPTNAEHDVVRGDVVDVQALVGARIVEGHDPSAARIAEIGVATGQVDAETGRHVIGEAPVPAQAKFASVLL